MPRRSNNCSNSLPFKIKVKFSQSLQNEIKLLDNDIQEMVQMLSSEEEEDRIVAAVNLQQECDEETIPFLIHALDDSSTSVQLTAVTTLWELANAKAVLPLMACINSQRDKKVSQEACGALKELINQDHLLKLLDYLDSDDELQIMYVLILLRKIHDVQALPTISPFLSSKNKDLRREAVITLRYLNQLTHFSPANLLANDSDKEVRKETMLTLGNFREECIVGILCDSLQNDESWEVRRNAAMALEIHSDHHSSQPLSCAISDVHWQVRKFSMRALSKVLSEEYLKDIIPLLCDEYSDVRKEAAIALGLLGSKDAVAPLKQSLDDADIEVRIASQKALNKIE